MTLEPSALPGQKDRVVPSHASVGRTRKSAYVFTFERRAQSRFATSGLLTRSGGPKKLHRDSRTKNFVGTGGNNEDAPCGCGRCSNIRFRIVVGPGNRGDFLGTDVAR